LVFWTFLIGSASLAALPLVTAGFYSKDLILWYAWASGAGSPWLWAAGLAGALLTSLYTFRMVFITFFGRARAQASRAPGLCINIPLLVLAALSIIGGFVQLPESLGDYPLFSRFVSTVLPEPTMARGGFDVELILQITAGLVSLFGIYLAYLFYARVPGYSDALARTHAGATLYRFWLGGWGFDRLYDKLIVEPYVRMARADRDDVIDLIYDGIAALTRGLHRMTSRTQTGQLRWYASGIAVGAVLTLALVLFL
jgi:NADH-quinone oxidoreductase subunit L